MFPNHPGMFPDLPGPSWTFLDLPRSSREVIFDTYSFEKKSACDLLGEEGAGGQRLDHGVELLAVELLVHLTSALLLGRRPPGRPTKPQRGE